MMEKSLFVKRKPLQTLLFATFAVNNVWLLTAQCNEIKLNVGCKSTSLFLLSMPKETKML